MNVATGNQREIQIKYELLEKYETGMSLAAGNQTEIQLKY